MKTLKHLFYQMPQGFIQFVWRRFFGIRIHGDSSIGAYSYLCRGTKIINTHIGTYCSIGERCSIGIGGEHSPESFSNYPLLREAASPLFGADIHAADGACAADGAGTDNDADETGTDDGASVGDNNIVNRSGVIIGNDVWIGEDATIRDGVTIGDGAVVGAKSMVTHDVPPFAIVAGNPAKLIRYRLNEEKRQLLRELAWWDWDIPQLRVNYERLCRFDSQTSDYER
jgi:acetyltransferase-like isoleucine patch superfamily enzyme